MVALTGAAHMLMRDALLLGAVQGITEFLPVSSSAHLLLLRRLIGQGEAPRALDVALHLATSAALVPTAYEDTILPGLGLAVDLARNGIQVGHYRAGSRVAIGIALATLPPVVVGGLAHRRIEPFGRRPEQVAAALIAGSVLMALAETGADLRYPRPSVRGARGGPGDVNRSVTGWLLLGVAQAAALLPGVSRSGATFAAGRILGLRREEAVRVSFALALPVTLAASVRVLPDLPRLLHARGTRPILAGSAAAFAGGVLGTALLRRLLPRWGPWPFVLYRCALALALLGLNRRDHQPR